MKKIKVAFVDFGPNSFREEYILDILRERYEVILSDTPDYLFYSVFSDKHLNYKEPVRIFVTTENIAPDFSLCDYSIDYEWMDYGDRHLRFPIYGYGKYEKDYRLCLKKHTRVDKDVLDEKKSFCSFVYSNADADPLRRGLFEKISKYKTVASGGRYMNNIGLRGGVTDKLQFQKKHKFSIACENSSHPGYTTEKLAESFAAQTIPIYWGDPWVKRVFNEKAFICVNDFATLDECVNYVAQIDQNEMMYINMLKEPAVISDEYSIEAMRENMKAFLYNIFDCDKSMAYRRNRVFWGNTYFEKHSRWKKVFDIVTLNLDIKILKRVRYIASKVIKMK